MDSLNALEKEYQTKIKRVAKKSEYIQMAMHELFSGYRPLESRINFEEADSLLKVSLKDYGINLDYDFGIVDPLTKELTVEKVADSKSELLSSQLRASLFPNDIIGEAGYLVIRFPNQKLYLMGKIWITLASSLIFIVIILLCFGFAIRTIFIQKKLSDIKNDFINNMTHEFKTPISTVSLACEALRDEQISSAPGLQKRYLGIINDENKRLGLQVEKVLQMAVSERKDFELKLEEVNLHDIITKALSNISLQISKNGGSIAKDLQAIHTSINADRMHLTNIIYNLLDNANKYSSSEPKIIISTMDTSKGIVIKILDEGIGMSKDMTSKIFEKFYRIPTGNRHDVKGFGLGLAYVKTMVEAHGGEISVHSELHKGSEFTVYLPFEYEKI
jgi:two-component system phosphate regulon sensor histidine kinase PhoR